MKATNDPWVDNRFFFVARLYSDLHPIYLEVHGPKMDNYLDIPYRRRKTYKMNSVISEILFSVESSSDSVYWCLILSIKKKQIKGFYWPFLAIDTTNGSSICIFNSWIVLMLIKGIVLNENGPLTVSFGSLVTFFSIILLLSVFVIPCNIYCLFVLTKWGKIIKLIFCNAGCVPDKMRDPYTYWWKDRNFEWVTKI